MKRILALLAASLLFTAPAAAQRHGEAAVLKIWDNRTAPHSNGIASPEREPEPDRIENVSAAELYVFPADSVRDRGLAVVICPGGGYMKLCMDYEGYDAARWFAANGVTAAVLKYRLPEGHPEVPLEDAVQALRIMAGLEAGATGYTADRVGIAGFSAGGHLAAAVSTLGTFKPAFSILFYPVTGDGKSPGCRITFDRLLGGRRTDAAVAAAWSPSRQVTAETPPALLFHSDDDATVPPSNSTAYYDALKRHGIEASLHIYPSGGHGWGLLGSFPYRETWQRAVLDWLDRLCAVPDGERRR